MYSVLWVIWTIEKSLQKNLSKTIEEQCEIELKWSLYRHHESPLTFLIGDFHDRSIPDKTTSSQRRIGLTCKIRINLAGRLFHARYSSALDFMRVTGKRSRKIVHSYPSSKSLPAYFSSLFLPWTRKRPKKGLLSIFPKNGVHKNQWSTR